MDAHGPVGLAVTVLVTEREHHDAIPVDLRRPSVEVEGDASVLARMTPAGVQIRVRATATGPLPATMIGRSAADPRAVGDAGWPWRLGDDPTGRRVGGIRLRAESRRGLAGVTDVFTAATARSSPATCGSPTGAATR